jgi:hypothetical protein
MMWVIYRATNWDTMGMASVLDVMLLGLLWFLCVEEVNESSISRATFERNNVVPVVKVDPSITQ